MVLFFINKLLLQRRYQCKHFHEVYFPTQAPYVNTAISLWNAWINVPSHDDSIYAPLRNRHFHTYECENIEINRHFSLFPATLITATAGTCYGWPSPTLPYLKSEESEIKTSPDEASWIVSIMILCSALTPIPSAYFADRFGRKSALLLGAVPFIIGWVLVIFAKSVAVLYVARMFSGLGYGIVYTVAPMYTGEIATNEVRGALSTLITLMNKVRYCRCYS